MIVPFAAGGPTDVISRIVTGHMAQTLGVDLRFHTAVSDAADLLEMRGFDAFAVDSQEAVLAELVEKLAILNMPHPYSLARELATNPDQMKYSQYARNFMDPEFYKQISLERLGNWVSGPAAKAGSALPTASVPLLVTLPATTP